MIVRGRASKSGWLPQYKWAALSIVIAAAAGLRFYGLFPDAPYFFNPDEKRLIDWGISFDYLHPSASEWGALPLLVVKIIYAILSFFYTPALPDIYLITRSFAALLGCATILLVYALGLKMYGQKPALYGAIFTTLTVLHIQYSHFYSLDGVFTFFVLVAFFPILAVAARGHTKSYVLAGICIGLTASVRLNGYLLLCPLLVAHYCGQFSRETGDTGRWSIPPLRVWPAYSLRLARLMAQRQLMLALFLSLGTFIAFNPALVLDPRKYLFYDGLVWIMLQASGYLKSQYTLQFEGTTPWFYVSNLWWAAGPFLLLAYLAGLIYGLLRWRQAGNLIVLSFLIVYLVMAADARVKFIRYTLPALPWLNMLAAAFLAAAWERPLWKWGLKTWLSLTLIGSALYALAFVNIYSETDPRILAARWIEANVPVGARIVHESDTVYAPPLGFYDEDQTRYRFAEINLDTLYESSSLYRESHLPPLLAGWGIEVSRRGKTGLAEAGQPSPLSAEQKWRYIGERLHCADYLVLSDRHYSVYQEQSRLFPVESEYYTRLFNGELGFYPIKSFIRRPNLLGWTIDDSSAELTFRIFDHPALWIFQAQLPGDFLKSHPPQVELAANWADQIRLAGYNLDKTAIKTGEKIRLVLYWEALAKAPRDYTVFLHLRNSSDQTVAQNDHQVADGLLPTSCWQSGRIIRDSFTLLVPGDIPAGDYRLIAGWYLPETLERLPLLNDIGGENALSLTQVRVEP